MPSGILIFAINSTFDYVKSASIAAKRAKKFLGLPVTLVTDGPVDNDIFDSVIVIPNSMGTLRQYKLADGSMTSIQWFNESRTLAYELSPYDKTLLIDADYFMFNDSLIHLFSTNTEFACWSDINDIARTVTQQVRLNEISIPMQWATVIYFTKCEFANAVFSFMEVIKNNWEYYSLLYHFRNHNFRNDYALSIALQAVSGYSTTNMNKLPGKLHTLFTDMEIVSATSSEVVFSNHGAVSKISNTNLHCMNKLAMENFDA